VRKKLRGLGELWGGALFFGFVSYFLMIHSIATAFLPRQSPDGNLYLWASGLVAVFLAAGYVLAAWTARQGPKARAWMSAQTLLALADTIPNVGRVGELGSCCHHAAAVYTALVPFALGSALALFGPLVIGGELASRRSPLDPRQRRRTGLKGWWGDWLVGSDSEV